MLAVTIAAPSLAGCDDGDFPASVDTATDSTGGPGCPIPIGEGVPEGAGVYPWPAFSPNNPSIAYAEFSDSCQLESSSFESGITTLALTCPTYVESTTAITAVVPSPQQLRFVPGSTIELTMGVASDFEGAAITIVRLEDASAGIVVGGVSSQGPIRLTDAYESAAANLLEELVPPIEVATCPHEVVPDRVLRHYLVRLAGGLSASVVENPAHDGASWLDVRASLEREHTPTGSVEWIELYFTYGVSPDL